MCNKLGMMHTECNLIVRDTKDEVAINGLKGLQKAIRVLQEDLVLLKKCTLDNPDFKWNDDKTGGYTEAKVKAFKNEV